ncbi:MAG: hypothetical protein JSW25_03280, partial [Thermoplasmata archaeon]
SMIVGLSTSATAQADFVTGAALEWTLDEPLPNKIESGEQFTVKLTFRNIGDVNLTGNKRVTIELSAKGETLDQTRLDDLRLNETRRVEFKVKLTGDGTYTLKLNAYNGGIVELYDNTGRKTSEIGTIKVETVEEPINWIPIIGGIVAVLVVVIIFYMMQQKKKKAEEEKRLADEARRKEMIRKKEEEIAKKIEVRQVVGKHPRDYYVLRRTKYANLKPSGLTRGGLTILSRVKTKAELEAERIVCPKCGTDLKEEGEECPRCTATEKIEAVRHDIRSYKSQADVDFTDAEALLRKAEHRLNWSDFAQAYELVTQAETRMNEIWDATEKGEEVESKVVEYSEAEGPSLESKVIGLEGEDLAKAAALTAAASAVEAEAAKEPEGKPCPDCGNAMMADECHYCAFDENMDAAWEVVEMAEMDGAKMDEVKDLLRQAKSAKERDNDDLAIRYVRRASRMADETYHDHARSKTEGIIEYTNTLIMTVKGMGEDVSMAEQMIAKAKEAMEANDYEAARSMASKADGYLKQMKEDSYRKRIGELMPAVEAGAPSNPEVEKFLTKAKALIEAGEYETAADLLEAANDKL